MKDKKQHHLTESKTFCMYPWLHLNVTPYGATYPCCSSDYTAPVGNVNQDSLASIFNNDKMKELRLNMLAGKKSDICTYCYKHEESSPYSFRTYGIEQFGKDYDNLIPTTQVDGTVPDFKMKYFDVRFSNVCNMKCRTCGSEFSSLWTKEAKKHDDLPATQKIIIKADETGSLMDEIKSQVPNMELVYFAGGEPLIMEEHYELLEEMLRTDANKNITLRYNTNMSGLKYKKYDLLDIWSKFKKVEISASIDHYGEKAEYIRHGTKWGDVEANLKSIRNLDYIDFQFNTVLSVFNYVTFQDFYNYLIDKDLLRPKDMVSIYRAITPSYYSAIALPKSLKEYANNSLNSLSQFMINNDWYQAHHVDDAIKFTNGEDTWEREKEAFRHHTNRRDKIRGEDFIKVFPELRSMLDE